MKVMAINTKLTEAITINDKPIETVDDFIYLGRVISTDNGTKKYIQARLSKSHTALQG
jgi:hypothetical protein